MIKYLFVYLFGAEYRQALYHLSHVPKPFCFINFLDRVSDFFAQGSLTLQFFYFHLLSSWDCRAAPPHLAVNATVLSTYYILTMTVRYYLMSIAHVLFMHIG
jgi:hypothetical protein